MKPITSAFGAALLVGVLLPYVDGGVCPGKTPDMQKAEFCDGGVQQTCEDIAAEAQCTGTKKYREKVTQDCSDLENVSCDQMEILCWQEWTCVWDAGDQECKQNTLQGSSNIMAKKQNPCGGPEGG